MWTSALFGAKNVGFFEIYGVTARTGGEVEPVRTFCEQGGEAQFFAILCRRPLLAAPYNSHTELQDRLLLT